MPENITKPENNSGKEVNFEKLDYKKLKQEILTLIKKEIIKKVNQEPYDIHFKNFSSKEAEELLNQLTEEDLKMYYRVTREDNSLTLNDFSQWQETIPSQAADTLDAFRAWLINQATNNLKLAKQFYPGIDLD